MSLQQVSTAALEDASVTTAKVAANAITYAKMQSVTAGKVLGRDTSGAGTVQELPISVDASGNVSTPTANTSIGSYGARTYLKTTTVGDSEIGGGAGSNYTAIMSNASECARAVGTEFRFNSGYGSVATAYGCRAWVRFDGSGTVAINGSGNVSSITDRGTGQYTVNFSTALPDANFAVSTGIRKSDSTEDGNMGVVLGSTSTTYSTAGFALTTRYFSNEGLKDASLVCASVFR